MPHLFVCSCAERITVDKIEEELVKSTQEVIRKPADSDSAKNDFVEEHGKLRGHQLQYIGEV